MSRCEGNKRRCVPLNGNPERITNSNVILESMEKNSQELHNPSGEICVMKPPGCVCVCVCVRACLGREGEGGYPELDTFLARVHFYSDLPQKPKLKS